MGPFPRYVRKLLLFTAFATAALTRGVALPAAEPEEPADSSAKKYTATAYLQVERHAPHILPQSAEKDDPGEFEYFCATQMQLIKSRFVIMAALRDPKVKDLPCIACEDAHHHAIAWLQNEIHVKRPDPQAGIIMVSLTSGDPQEAAVLVNAVVEAYMNEVVNSDRQARRGLLSDLQKISAEKENEVRTKREQLKRELENIGVATDDQTAAARVQLAMQMSMEVQSELQRMKSEHRKLLGQLAEAKEVMVDLHTTAIAEVQVAALLNNNPVFRNLQNRRSNLELEIRHYDSANPPGTPPASAQKQRLADDESTQKQLDALHEETAESIRQSLRIELANTIKRLERHVEISTGQLAAFEKDAEKKAADAADVGKTSVSVEMARADVEEIERVLHAVAQERERLKIELNAPPRVTVLGDRSAPAAVPTSPD